MPFVFRNQDGSKMEIPSELELLARIIMLFCDHWNEHHARKTGLHFNVHISHPEPKTTKQIKD